MDVNYNDGLWHGWNGGECPVHPKTQVQALEQIGVNWTAFAEDCDWVSFKGAFRVVKEYREPREFWVAKNAPSGVRTATDKPPFYSPDGWIRVREVMDGAE